MKKRGFLSAVAMVVAVSLTSHGQRTEVINSMRYSPELEKLAEQGSPEAQNNLGVLYLNGAGVEADTLKAIYWFEKGAEGGSHGAQSNLAAAYIKGNGVERNYAKALELYEEAARYDHGAALLGLAQMYLNGWGVSQDPEKVFAYAKRTADMERKDQVGVFDKNDVDRKDERAITGQAQAMVADCYMRGRGTTRDMQIAMEYIRRSADNGFPASCLVMADAMEKGEGVEKNLSTAERYFNTAANGGIWRAQYILGMRYADGKVFKKKPEDAVRYLTMVVENTGKVPPMVKASAMLKLADLLEATGNDADAAKASGLRNQAGSLPSPDPAKIDSLIYD